MQENVSKAINDKLKSLSEGDQKKSCEILSKLNEEHVSSNLC